VEFKLHAMRSTDIYDYVAARSISVNAQDITVQEVIRLLKKYDEKAEEVQRIVKVDRFRVEVVLRFGEAVERFRASTDLPFQVRGKTFTMSYFGKQNICVRVHWLPVIMNNDVLHEFFSTFGKVVKGDFERHGDFENGVFRNSAYESLVTMSGRAPLCLRCGEVGNVRQTCPPLPVAPGAVTVRGTEAPRQREAVGTQATATPGEMAPVVANSPTTAPAVTAPAVTAPAETAPAAAAPAVTTPAAGTEDAKDAVESDTSGEESDMEWVEVRGRRRSRSRSSEGRADCVKRACGS